MNSRLMVAGACSVLAVMGIAGPGFAQQSGVRDVELEALEADSGLIQRLGSRYVMAIPLEVPADVGDCPAGQAGDRRVTSVEIDPVSDGAHTRTFFPGPLMAGRDICATDTILVPLTLDVSPPNAFDITVRFSDGSAATRSGVTFEASEATAARGASDPVQSEFKLLNGDDGGKIGLSWDIALDLTVLARSAPILNDVDEARFNFSGETAASGESLDFKEVMKLDSSFIYRFGGYGQYYSIVAKPIAFESDSEASTINYRGSVSFNFEVPGTRELSRVIQPLFGGCTQSSEVNCTAFGLIGGVGYSANTVVKEVDGAVNLSEDFVTTAAAVWNFPLGDRMRFNARYDWQSDSPDGTTSESSEIGVTYRPLCSSDISLTVSWIDGEFLPGDQKRDGVRFGLSRLFGAQNGC